MKWFVEIVEYGTNAVIERIDCKSENGAERTDDGVNINLNHEKFFTRVVNE
jgi:hypothetical protein